MDALIDAVTCGDSLQVLKAVPDNSMDLVATDPPYGLAFMGKDWDRALPGIDIWKECLRVLKPGAWAFVMSIPRLDCLSRMAGRLMKAGFDVSFTPLFWAYASGFPKAMNISKAVDKRLGAEREIVGRNPNDRARRDNALSDYGLQGGVGKGYITRSSTEQARQLEGAYGGFQPKPAVEVIIVAMKPMGEKTYAEQALANRKGVTWLDDCRIPYRSHDDKPKDTVAPGWSAQDRKNAEEGYRPKQYTTDDFDWKSDQKGRFPANLLVSDDALNDGQNFNKGGSINGAGPRHNQVYGDDRRPRGDWLAYGDAGSFSRYFDLDQWWEDRLAQLPGSVQKVFPFFIVPKAGKREKNKGCEQLEGHLHETGARTYDDVCANCGKKLVGDLPYRCVCEEKITQHRVTKGNFHPTVKPLKLMSYLITLGSRESDVVLDPFVGSGTTALAARLLGRRFVAIEVRPEYVEIAKARLGILDTARSNVGRQSR